MIELVPATTDASGTSADIRVGPFGIVLSAQFQISATASITLWGSLDGVDFAPILSETASKLHAVTPCTFMRATWTGNTGTIRVMTNPNV